MSRHGHDGGLRNQPAILSGWLYVPLASIGSFDSVERVKNRLTYRPRYAENGDRLRLYTESLPGYLGVPRAWGLQSYRNLPVDDRTSLGQPFTAAKLPSPHHPKVLDPSAQAKFAGDVESSLRAHRSLVAMAATGSGKTVVALRVAGKLGVSTLVICHLERLMHQWREEIHDKLGVPLEQIGIVQGDRCEYDRTICVGMLHSIAQRRYPEPFYKAFGLVIVDEVHKVGAEYFLPAIPRFSSFYRLGLSATPNRRDGAERAYYWHIGPVRVTSQATALPLTVHVLRYRGHPLAESDPMRRLLELSRDDERNRLIARMVLRFHQSGRTALIVSHFVRHVQELMHLSAEAGVPAEDMGQYTSERHTGMVAIRRADGRIKGYKAKKETIPNCELTNTKETAQIIFATYGMIKEGIDIPRLDTGMDATPSVDAEQLIGRVRRPFPGKRPALWVTVLDTHCPVMVKKFKNRCNDYRATGARVSVG